MIRAGLILIFALGAALWWQSARLSSARDALAVAEARRDALEEAGRINARAVKELQAQAQEAAALDRELQEGSGADAPLSDYLGRGAGRVWP